MSNSISTSTLINAITKELNKLYVRALKGENVQARIKELEADRRTLRKVLVAEGWKSAKSGLKTALGKESRQKAAIYAKLGLGRSSEAMTTATGKVSDFVKGLRKKEENVAEDSLNTQDVIERAAKLDTLTDEERAQLSALLNKANG